MPTEMDLAAERRVMSVIEEEVARRCGKVEEDCRIQIKLREESDRRAAKFEKQCKKMRAKLRRLEKRSVCITKPAKIQGKQMVPEARAGSKSGTAGLQEEGSQQQTKRKTKFVRMSQRATHIVMARSDAPFPRIPSWRLSKMPESTQELYKRSVATSEKIHAIYDSMREQFWRKGYIEVEVADDGDDNTEE